jgi:hypothetical protein
MFGLGISGLDRDFFVEDDEGVNLEEAAPDTAVTDAGQDNELDSQTTSTQPAPASGNDKPREHGTNAVSVGSQQGRHPVLDLPQWTNFEDSSTRLDSQSTAASSSAGPSQDTGPQTQETHLTAPSEHGHSQKSQAHVEDQMVDDDQDVKKPKKFVSFLDHRAPHPDSEKRKRHGDHMVDDDEDIDRPKRKFASFLDHHKQHADSEKDAQHAGSKKQKRGHDIDDVDMEGLELDAETAPSEHGHSQKYHAYVEDVTMDDDEDFQKPKKRLSSFLDHHKQHADSEKDGQYAGSKKQKNDYEFLDIAAEDIRIEFGKGKTADPDIDEDEWEDLLGNDEAAQPPGYPLNQIAKDKKMINERLQAEWRKAETADLMKEEYMFMAPAGVSEKGVEPETEILLKNLSGQDKDDDDIEEVPRHDSNAGSFGDAASHHRGDTFNFFEHLCKRPELVYEVAKCIRPDDLSNLFSISRDVNFIINGHLTHTMKLCAKWQAPESSRVFLFSLYSSLCIKDPVQRRLDKYPDMVRLAPSLRWLKMVYYREKAVRDILACLARQGHRTPKTMSLTLKKAWLTMDMSVNSRRIKLMQDERYWTDNDLFNLQLFIMKLDMMLCHPMAGAGDHHLRDLMLGQRSLGPLHRLLKREQYKDAMEVLEASVRYRYNRPDLINRHPGQALFGVPWDQVGTGHLEGWGIGVAHLYRLDELVIRESFRRKLALEKHIQNMFLWGYVDHKTGENIEVTDEEMYMSDDEDLLRKWKRGCIKKAAQGLKTPGILATTIDLSDEGLAQEREEMMGVVQANEEQEANENELIYDDDEVNDAVHNGYDPDNDDDQAWEDYEYDEDNEKE